MTTAPVNDHLEPQSRTPWRANGIARLLVVVLAGLCLLVGLPVTQAQAAANGPETELLALINAERTSRGITPLQLDPVVSDRLSRPWSSQMAATGALGHSSEFFSSITGIYPSTDSAAENVGYAPSASALHSALMGSAGHRTNILNPAYRYIGLGAVTSGGRLWLTQTFFSTSDAVAPSVDAAARTQAENYVRALYVDFLGRPVDPAGFVYWTTQLSSGRLSPNQVAYALAFSDEWLNRVLTGFYSDALGRVPDPTGRADWMRMLRGGMPVADVAASFYSSQEYFLRVGGSPATLPTWVSDLYRQQLGREADPVGLATWVAVAQSSGRFAVTAPFYGSAETLRRRVDGLYVSLLGRGADPAGLATWPSVVRSQGDLALAAFIASSPEYWARAQSR